MNHSDYLIIGSGIAGISLAIKLAQRFPSRTITVVTKAGDDESNTKYAQGGIAVVTGQRSDSWQKHVEDTLICGDGLCDPEVVEMVVKDGPQRLQELIAWGAHFDKDSNGALDLGREGGHSEHRVVHQKDRTGYEIEKTLLAQAGKQPNIQLLAHHLTMELMVESNRCVGAWVLDEKSYRLRPFIASYTVLATGGIGKVYGHTTNPSVATGDGIAMAYRAGAQIGDMEFIQFHPTVLHSNMPGMSFLISEAVRGFGAYLINKYGYRFMFDYDSRGELASRDIVSRSIYSEMQASGDSCVYMDCRHFQPGDFQHHFPVIYAHCIQVGIDPTADLIPVVPAQHYLCGGIVVSKDGQSSIAHLYACGECARTGLHGANRLASNSLLEALVYSNRIYCHLESAPLVDQLPCPVISSDKFIFNESLNNYANQRLHELQQLMRDYVGIVRNDEHLQQAALQIDAWHKEAEISNHSNTGAKAFIEYRNMLDVASLIVKHSMARNENKGAFYKKEWIGIG